MPTAVLLPVLDNTKKKRYIIDVYLIWTMCYVYKTRVIFSGI
jgi:hypothetical protein